MHNILELTNFRGLSDFTVKLKPVTLFSGKNNVGKTSILESIFMLHDYSNPDVFHKLSHFRGINTIGPVPVQKIWETIFYDIDLDNQLRIKTDAFALNLRKNDDYILPPDLPNDLNNMFGTTPLKYALSCLVESDGKTFKGDYIEKNGNISLTWDRGTTQLISIPFVQYIGPAVRLDAMSTANWFGELEKMGKKQKVVEALQILDENILDLTTIVTDNVVQLYVTDKQNRKMPIGILGDGIIKVLSVALTLLANPGCIVLLDEIENGLHYSLYSKFWTFISKIAVQENSQVIATSHSYECIKGALDGIKEENLNDIFAYIRLDRTMDGVSAKQFSGETLEFAIDSRLEIR